MGMLKIYLQSFFNIKRYYKGVSLFAIWDKASHFSKKIYIAPTARLYGSTVDDYSRIRQFTTIHDTKIGKYCSISRNVRIGLGEHPTNLLSTNSIFYSHQKNEIRGDWVKSTSFREYKEIEIGNDVWIGEFVTIKGGIKIGDGAIVAARAVVTKDVPPYAIVAGIPARVVKFRFTEETIERLLKIRWWDLNESEIEKSLEAFTIFDISKEELDQFFTHSI